MRNFLLTMGAWLLSYLASAQTYNKLEPSINSKPFSFSLQGRVTDTSGTTLKDATVMLLTPKDSSLVNFGHTNEFGIFVLRHVRRNIYILKITHVGYIPISQIISPPKDSLLNIGELKLKPIIKELMEVVVRTAKAALVIRGDTIEYDATTFKVPIGSTVEDLLRRLPGVQVEQNGNIKAQGRDVKRITVDGKAFFGTDPTMASKNLQAEAISKVQVYEDQTEKAKTTGVDDGTKEKTINLELKNEFKKNGFGKIVAGGGSAEKTTNHARGEVKGNYNKFDTKNQFSLIGLINNTNLAGLSWDDYQDFRGSNSFDLNDDADFGFSGGGVYYAPSGSTDDSENLNISANGSRDRGFSNNAAIGTNYNYDTEKLRVSFNYYYSQTRLQLDALRTRQSFFEGGSLLNNERNRQVNFIGAHRGGLRVEYQLDSLQTLTFLNNTRVGVSNSSLLSFVEVFRNRIDLITNTSINNNVNGSTFGTANTLIYRLKFKKKGRLFAASATYQLNSFNGNTDLESESDFFQIPTLNRFLNNLNQLQITTTHRSQYKANLQYVEPITKKIFWETFYNTSLRDDLFDRNSFSKIGDVLGERNDTLSRYYINSYQYNRIGSGFRYMFKGLNISMGGAYQQFLLKGNYAADQTSPILNRIKRTFTTFVPNISFNYRVPNKYYIYGAYRFNVQVPNSRDLQPVVDVSNPLFTNEGNPNLLPSLQHTMNIGFGINNPNNFINIFGNIYYNYGINQIVYGQTTDIITGVIRSRPENISGGQNVGMYIGGGLPLKKNKVVLNINLNGSIGRTLIPVNTKLISTDITSRGLNPKIDLTMIDWLSVYINANWSTSNTDFDMQSSQDQQIINNAYNVSSNLKLPKKLYINSSFNYSVNRNSSFDFYQRIPIFNTSLYKIMGKNNRSEFRFSVFDILNRNIGVSQIATLNFVQQERVQTLSRYFLLSFSYNIRGITPVDNKQ